MARIPIDNGPCADDAVTNGRRIHLNIRTGWSAEAGRGTFRVDKSGEGRAGLRIGEDHEHELGEEEDAALHGLGSYFCRRALF